MNARERSQKYRFIRVATKVLQVGLLRTNAVPLAEGVVHALAEVNVMRRHGRPMKGLPTAFFIRISRLLLGPQVLGASEITADTMEAAERRGVVVDTTGGRALIFGPAWGGEFPFNV